MAMKKTRFGNDIKTVIVFIISLLFTVNACSEDNKEQPVSDRQYWCDMAYKISHPVLDALSKGELKKLMPVEQQKDATGREHFAYLEALGRLLCGISPWIESGETAGKEGKQRAELTALALKGIRNAVDPASPDYMNFTEQHGRQPLVDAAFLAHAFLRSPKVLWGGLDKETQKLVIEAMCLSRTIEPYESNWLLFSAMIETFLMETGEEWNYERINDAIVKHEQWYKGDGLYGDGPEFHWDYYNSFVIQPMMVDIARILVKHNKMEERQCAEIIKRSVRYSAILERLISPEGTYPAIGRSLAYRMGAFQMLSQTALQKNLPKEVKPAQVRCALTAVMKKQMTAPGTFDDNGWLKIGLYGAQPAVGEGYICTGSLYLCSVALLPLGLPASDEFWSAPAEAWTQVKVWTGHDFSIDHSIN
ncbi:MAG: DUF2264 domain-containing protein [Tannerella sp.]|jgi:hypothetical protein|nr:DUF2264 domain-containing protein [Tannerella sp.]